MIRCSILILAIVCGAGATAFGQAQYCPAPQQQRYAKVNPALFDDDLKDSFFYEVHNVPSDGRDSTSFLVYYRLRYDKIEFVRALRPVRPYQAYVGEPQFNVRFVDANGSTAYSKSIRNKLYVGTHDDAQLKHKFMHGSFTVTLPTGMYSLHFEYGEFKSDKPTTFVKEELVGADFHSSGITSDALFAYASTTERTGSMVPFVMNGNVKFASDMRVILSVSGIEKDQKFDYIVRQHTVNARERGGANSNAVDLVGDARAELHSRIIVDPGSTHLKTVLTKQLPENYNGQGIPSGDSRSSQPRLNDDDPNEDIAFGLVDFTVATSALEEGEYELLAYSDDGRDTLRQEFTIEWLDKPLSLKNKRYALDIVKYLLTEDEHDDMLDGNLDESYENLLSYWQERDPTPGSAFNEAMAAYHARVDYAYYNYRDFGNKDGANTDRGKIYILYGKPTTTERTMSPDGPPVEVWRYAKLKKEFYFESPSSGRFVLKSMSEQQ